MWGERVASYAREFLSGNTALRDVAGEAAVLLHGSTTLGIDDPYSDLDLWLLVPDDALAALDSAAGTRFFPFKMAGKEGHITVEPREEFERRVRQCDLPLIAELRTAGVV